MTRSAAAAPGTLDPAYAAIKRMVIERTGHHYYEDKDDLLFERIRRRVVETGSRGFEDYLARLDAADGGGEWAALVSGITIGETYFFRYAEQFAALKGVILPEIIARNQASRRLRIWSAGCSTGAEPYSVAVLVHEALGPALAHWTVSIVGSDIDEVVLAQAREAVFGRWALRSLNAEERARWFEPGPAPNSFRLARRYAGLVRFERHNLLSLADGTSPLQFSDYDLILCRNVLIYFRPDRVEAIVAGLGRALAPGGWLLLGHAESHPAYTGTLAPVELAGATAYRAAADVAAAPKPARLAVPAEAAPPVPPPPPSRRAAGPAARSRRPVPPPAVATEAPRPEPGDPAAALAAIRAHADRGEGAAALEACRAAQAAAPSAAEPHFYEGLIERAAGMAEAAEAAFRRALYLDRDFVLAHYHLGLTLREAGRKPGWRRPIAHAARLAARLDPARPLPEGDGLSAGELVQLARFLLDRAEAEP